MPHLTSSESSVTEDSWPSLVLVHKQDRAHRERRARSCRRHRGDGDAASTTTSTSFQELGDLDLDDLVEEHYDPLGEEQEAHLAGFMDMLNCEQARSQEDSTYSADIPEQAERRSR